MVEPWPWRFLVSSSVQTAEEANANTGQDMDGSVDGVSVVLKTSQQTERMGG